MRPHERTWGLCAALCLCSLATVADARPARMLEHLADQGIEPALVIQQEGLANLSGGAQRGSAAITNVHAQLMLDSQRLLDVPGSIVFVDVLSIYGGHPSALVGDAQGVSNIEARRGTRLFEAWLQHNFAGGRTSVLLGLYDINSEFYALDSAGLFLNSSFGIGPEFSQAGRYGPSLFPRAAPGARIALRPGSHWIARAALMSGTPFDAPPAQFEPGTRAGAVVISEIDWVDRAAAESRATSRRLRIGRLAAGLPYDTKLAAGAWYFTGTFDGLRAPATAPDLHRGSAGAYVLADNVVARDAAQPGRQLSGFIQAGWGDERLTQFGSSVSTGLVASGVLASRPDDQSGLAVTWARTSSGYRRQQAGLRQPATGAETAIELTHLINLHRALAVQFGAQYIIRPGAAPQTGNAFTIQMRVELSL